MMNKLVVRFQQDFPELVSLMRRCNHHNENPFHINPYHQEGDVWTHTMMVCKLAEGQSEAVQLAALLHDIAKPFSRGVNKRDWITFYNHEPMSAFLALEIMDRWDIDHTIRELVFNAIALHTDVFKLTPQQLRDRMVNNSALYETVVALGKADHEGRFTDDPVPLVRMSPIYRPISSSEKMLVMLVGLPCSGKSTLLGQKYSEYDVISRDDIVKEFYPSNSYNESWKAADQGRVDGELKRRINMAAEKSSKVVIDMTNLTRKGRKAILDKFQDFNKVAEVMLTNPVVIGERNAAREGKVIDSEVLDSMTARFYPPLRDEFDTIIYNF